MIQRGEWIERFLHFYKSFWEDGDQIDRERFQFLEQFFWLKVDFGQGIFSISRGTFRILEELLEPIMVEAIEIAPHLWTIMEKVGSAPHPFCPHFS
jgi:hypothetical protein